ncbi:hypothetical protein [Archangium primigenium]|uniref:hypothetical protein n=1 Tax=[Archangium] primigenium TaxID=2792470 RepID=UPI00195A26DD|nr:hypothetical protein [Archangium primigenium]MBM7118662.1 hypothetical protein [Archangium primigenium]
MSRRVGVLGVGLCAASALAAAPESAGGLSWEKTFGPPATKPDLQVKARTEDPSGGTHTLELWRDGERWLRRRTDGLLEVWVEDQGPAGAPAHAVTVVDRRSGTVRRVSVERSAKLGPAFTWWPLAHLLPLPGPRYTLRRLKAPALRVGSARCDWYVFLPEGQPEQRICWSREYALALRHEEKRGAGWWTRLAVDSVGPLTDKAAAFHLESEGLRDVPLPEPAED